VLLAAKAANGQVSERLYLLPPDAQAERWTGVRAKPHEAAEKSGIEDIRFLNRFEDDFSRLAASGEYAKLYLDLYRFDGNQPDRPSHRLLHAVQRDFAYLQIKNAAELTGLLRLIKQPCEIEALRRAEEPAQAYLQ